MCEHRCRLIDLDTLDDLATGCAVLGTGGGGDVGPSLLQARATISSFGPVPDFVAEVAGDRRQHELARATHLAGERAVAAGARPDALETIWIEEIPLAYVDRPVSRLRAKVAGPPVEDAR